MDFSKTGESNSFSQVEGKLGNRNWLLLSVGLYTAGKDGFLVTS